MTLETLELNKLLGISIVYENDLYEFAELVLKIMYSVDKMGRKTISKPTLNGLVQYYSMICGQKLTQNKILDVAKKCVMWFQQVLQRIRLLFQLSEKKRVASFFLQMFPRKLKRNR